MKQFIFTVDDNIRFFKELTQGSYHSIFDHPYLGVYWRLHQKHGLKVQLNLFYEMPDFNLSQMTDRYREEWQANADWLKLSFHSKLENAYPYEHSGYDEVFSDCRDVHREILRFASPRSLAATTTVHCCRTTDEGIAALGDNGVRGLLGLYGTEEKPRSSYQSTPVEGDRIRRGEIAVRDGMAYAGIDIVLNSFSKEEILAKLSALTARELIKVMIHEQYFYADYRAYQPDFEEKLDATFAYLRENRFQSVFYEEVLT
jgi:hypothetical protein